MNKKEDFKVGDRVEFTRGFNKGQKGTLVGVKDSSGSSFSIAGVPWYSIKMDAGFVRSGQFDGDFKKLKEAYA